MIAQRRRRGVSELLGIADEDFAFALMIDMSAEYELIKLDEAREEKKLIRLADLMLHGHMRNASGDQGGI
jgi:hypothetical protein